MFLFVSNSKYKMKMEMKMKIDVGTKQSFSYNILSSFWKSIPKRFKENRKLFDVKPMKNADSNYELRVMQLKTTNV